MGVSSYLEFITVLFGWVMYDNLWSILAQTGIIYVPFVLIILNNIMESRKGGDDEGPAALQSLKKSEVDVIVGLVVMFLAAVPFTELELGQMTYVRPTLDCELAQAIRDGREPSEVAGDEEGIPYGGALAKLGEETGRVPIWWGFVHQLSKAVVSASVAAIPCSDDVTGLATRMAGTRIDDDLLHELARFKYDCHNRAINCVKRPGKCGWEMDRGERRRKWRGTEYLGHRKFFEVPGIYPTFQSAAPVDGFPRDEERDRAFEGPGGYPRCSEWWDDDAMGIKTRLLAQFDESLKKRLVLDPDAKYRRELGEGSSVEARYDLMLNNVLKGRAKSAGQAMNPGDSLSYRVGYREAWGGEDGLWAKVDSVTTKLAAEAAAGLGAGIGMILAAPGQAAASLIVRQGMPMFLALLLMVFVAILPLLMVFSRYDPGTLMVLTIVFFGLQFVYVLWGMAFWVDQYLTDAWGSWFANPVQGGIMLWVQRFLYLIFPMIWMLGLSWVGVRGSDAFGQGVMGPAGGSAGMGEAGGGVVSNLATKGAGTMASGAAGAAKAARS